ncbi:hypothetical protein [Neobacillus sp.]|uniref:hypothetical protein n=1 Tax=Neobacillus sp. TaxID=2675273 RepID=UPI0028A26603|nr:hypothetical protein [Neobacillus sp.]
MIYEVISKYHELSRIDKHHRFKSWEHCYHFFSTNYKSLNDEKTFDHGCLHLAFYLASWGMLRGGAFLLQKDYRIHEFFINDVVKKTYYHHFYDHELQQSMNKLSVEGIDKLIKETTESYINNIPQINGEDKLISVTDTLASKILLGVYGNVPAYDRYLKGALKLHGINQQFNEASLLELVDFYNVYRDEFEKCHQLFSKDGTYYTPMKLIDMYFWQVGFLMVTVDENNSELVNIKEFASTFSNYRCRQFNNLALIMPKSIKNPGLTDKIREYIISRLKQAKEEGITSIDLKSGDIHKSLMLENRMPPVCNAMGSLGVYRIEIIHDTPSGASSTKIVRYYL